MSGRRQEDARLVFERVYRETRMDLLAYLVRRSESVEDAADLLAETYLVAWRKLEAVPAGAAARLWLFGVARNLLRKGAGNRATQRVLIERLADELRCAQPVSAPVEGERSAALRSAFASLSEDDRELLMLTAWEELAPREIAAALGTPVNVVRVRLHRARKRLARALEPPAARARGRMNPSRIA